jgi:hypothetical protein
MIDLDAAHLTISAATALGLIGMLVRFTSRFSKLEVKVDTIWDFQMRRAIVNAVASGNATINSPVVFTSEFLKHFRSMASDLRLFYTTVGHSLSERDLQLEMERRFGDRFLKEICIPAGVSSGECILAAIQVAREPAEEYAAAPEVKA